MLIYHYNLKSTYLEILVINICKQWCKVDLPPFSFAFQLEIKLIQKSLITFLFALVTGTFIRSNIFFTIKVSILSSCGNEREPKIPALHISFDPVCCKLLTYNLAGK